MEISTTLSLNSVPRISPSVSLSSCKSLVFNNGGTNLLKKKNKNCLVLNRSSKAQNGFNCRSMFGLGVPEIVVIAGVATLLFGPKKLPEIGRSFGQTFKSFQQAAKEFETELKKEPEPLIEPLTEKPIVVSEEEKRSVKVSSTTES
ncbi:Sec-independent protein translocase protein TatA/B/E [Macleaya cordata]|uniref:Sec-independent protein translocase protein TatA/B/E n=1 Tax=Macleaya cordata TaxID=56857 RepID=A0A200RDS4_MACCD|nr:Sec-independent protein translocase protein TatA/B/E [Macleaya cordata]